MFFVQFGLHRKVKKGVFSRTACTQAFNLTSRLIVQSLQSSVLSFPKLPMVPFEHAKVDSHRGSRLSSKPLRPCDIEPEA